MMADESSVFALFDQLGTLPGVPSVSVTTAITTRAPFLVRANLLSIITLVNAVIDVPSQRMPPRRLYGPSTIPQSCYVGTAPIQF